MTRRTRIEMDPTRRDLEVDPDAFLKSGQLDYGCIFLEAPEYSKWMMEFTPSGPHEETTEEMYRESRARGGDLFMYNAGLIRSNVQIRSPFRPYWIHCINWTDIRQEPEISGQANEPTDGEEKYMPRSE